MISILRKLLPLVVLGIPAGNLVAQSELSTPADAVVNKSSIAVAYPVDKGSTKIDLKGTALMPSAKGEAKVEAKQGITHIEAKVEHLEQPGKLGTQFLTYVLWVVSPDGRTNNLGEILLNEDGNGNLKVTSQLQTFSLIVTSEPYYSVRQPSELVVLENAPAKDTKGTLVAVDQYRLMKRGQYDKLENPLALSLDTKNVPLQLYEARNAVDIAKSRGADKYAAEIHSRAESNLILAENLLQQKADRNEIISAARQTVQLAEDARAFAVDRQEQERIASERAAAADTARAEAEAKAAEESAAARHLAEEESRHQAELAAANEARLKAEAKAEADACRPRRRRREPRPNVCIRRQKHNAHSCWSSSTVFSTLAILRVVSWSTWRMCPLIPASMIYARRPAKSLQGSQVSLPFILISTSRSRDTPTTRVAGI